MKTSKIYEHYLEACKNLKNPIKETKEQPLEIILKPEILNIDSLEKVNTTAKYFWRPEDFKQYVGQENLKQILTGYIRGCKELNRTFPHVLISGGAGTGKTTVINIIANQLNLPFVECVANTITSQQQFIDKLSEVKGGFLYLDEIHTISKKVANFILPILEDFQVNGTRIKPFALCGATTELGVLIKKFKPLVDRMKILKELDPYSISELETLIKQYKEKNFPSLEVEANVYVIIAMNCRNTPRIAIRILESYLFMKKPISEILRIYNIIKDSITQKDIKVLQLLKEKEKGIGIKAIASYLGTSEENYIYQHESYLLQQELITIGARRQITEKGKLFLTQLKM